MKKKITLIGVLLTITCSAQIIDPAPYCSSDFDNNFNMIDSLAINEFNYSFGPVHVDNTYTYNNHVTGPSLTTGGTADIEIYFYFVGDLEPAFFGLWIDYNQNDSFEPSELVAQNSNTIMERIDPDSDITITKTITIPADAVAGTTRMRISRGEDAENLYDGYNPSFSLSPCNDPSGNSYGCTYDFDVTIETGSSGISDNASIQNLTNVFPNPTSEKLNIEYNVFDNKIVKAEIFNAQGKKITAIESKLELTEIDVTSFDNGIYFIRLHNESGKTSFHKILKN